MIANNLFPVLKTFVAPTYFIFINFNFNISIFFIYLSFVIIIKHKENIKRLINKTENKIKLSK